MSVYLSVAITLKDRETFTEYGVKARPLFAEYGAEPVMVGQVAGHLHGTSDHHLEVIARFPDREALENWYASPAYQALIPLRDKGADVVFKIVEPL
ncbi:MAG: DUF1330 domain-containing protein [Arenibacterium sp.]